MVIFEEKPHKLYDFYRWHKKSNNNNNKHNIIYFFIFSQNNSYGSAIGSPKQRERKRQMEKGQMVGMRKKMELGRKEERVKYE